MRFNAPSPVAATDVCGFMPAVGGCLAATPPDDVEPHALIAITAAPAAATATSRWIWLPFIFPLLSVLFPGRKRDQATRPAEHAGLPGPGRAPGRPYSGVLQRVTPHGQGAR